MGLQFDPDLPFAGRPWRRPPWWEPWAVLGMCLLAVLIGWLWGR